MFLQAKLIGICRIPYTPKSGARAVVVGADVAVHVLRGAAEDVSAGSTAPGAAAEDVAVGSWAPGAPEDVPMHYVPPGAAVDVSAGAVAGHSWR